jgi:hypothetical protein
VVQRKLISFNLEVSIWGCLERHLKLQRFWKYSSWRDPDLSIRLWNLGFETRLIPDYVYHKRRIDWDKFSVQVNKFGKARPILNSWYPKHNKLLPSVFIIDSFVPF